MNRLKPSPEPHYPPQASMSQPAPSLPARFQAWWVWIGFALFAAALFLVPLLQALFDDTAHAPVQSGYAQVVGKNVIGGRNPRQVYRFRIGSHDATCVIPVSMTSHLFNVDVGDTVLAKYRIGSRGNYDVLYWRPPNISARQSNRRIPFHVYHDNPETAKSADGR